VAADGGEPRLLGDLFHDPAEWDAVRAEVEDGQVCRRSVRLRGSGGEPVHAELTCVAMHDTRGGRQIQAIIHAAETYPDAAAMDELYDARTGMPNRTALLRHVTRALAASAERPERRFAVMHLDLNRFQRVNETLGHQRGDELLALAAQRLDACVRPGDVVARAEGDDFLVLLNGVRGEAEAMRIAERMSRALGGGYHLDGQEVFCGADVGVVMGGSGHANPAASGSMSPRCTVRGGGGGVSEAVAVGGSGLLAGGGSFAGSAHATGGSGAGTIATGSTTGTSLSLSLIGATAGAPRIFSIVR